MTIELNDFDPDCDVSDYLDWVLETGIWNGRQVSWREASEFRDEIQARIYELLLKSPDDAVFEQLSAQLAWIGTPASNQAFLSRDIQELDFSKGDLILQVGLKKSLSKFWKKHKKEILIGAAIVAVVTVVVVVAVSTGGTGAGPAAAAGGAALGTSSDKDKKDKPASKDPQLKQENSASQNTNLETPPITSVSLDPSFINGKLIFGETGVLIDGQYSSYKNIMLNQNETIFPISPFLQEFPTFPVLGSEEAKADTPPQGNSSPVSTNPKPPEFSNFSDSLGHGRSDYEVIGPVSSTEFNNQPPSTERPQSWIANFFDAIGKRIKEIPELFDSNISPADRELSSRFSTLGERASWMSFSSINGINTSKEEAIAHAEYLAQFTKGHSIDWVYNRSHGPIIDVAEIVTMNYPGYSPNTAQLLRENWDAFHTNNLGRPHAKYLQFCHSQGAIHVRNALAKAPKEIQDRVIVVAIAPAAIIPSEICFDSYNYASKSDPIPYGELVFAGALDSSEYGSSKRFEMIMELREQLILLEPHPDALGMDHDFQSPTFKRIIADHLNEYIKREGEYR